jgi:dTDP-glucose 4,6-dehydratase
VQNLMVTGGAGFIGSNFVRYMLEKYPDYNVVVYDKLTYAGNLDNLKDITERFADRYAFVQGDICDAATVRESIHAHGVDTIINFAAESHVDRSIMDPDAFIKTDVYGTYVLLEATREFGLERMHQVSTDEVYGHVPEGASKETDPVNPRSPYAASKTSGDLLVNAYHITYDVPVTITRGANNIGPYQYPEKVVPLFVTNAIDDLPLPLYGDGLQVRDYQYVLDHCEAIDLILHRGKIGGIYNIGTGTEMRNIDMAHLLLSILNKPESLIQPVRDRPGHDRRYALNVDKIRALGWEPAHTCEEAIDKTVHWYIENEWWWRPIKSGKHYQEYYKRQYEGREVTTSNSSQT